MKHILFAFAGLLTLLAAVDIIVLNDVTRGMLAIVLASSILVLGKLDTMASNSYADRQQEKDDLVISLIDRVCLECQSGQELFLDKENFYCHWDEEEKDYLICLAHPLHDTVNSWAVQVEE